MASSDKPVPGSVIHAVARRIAAWRWWDKGGLNPPPEIPEPTGRDLRRALEIISIVWDMTGDTTARETEDPA